MTKVYNMKTDQAFAALDELLKAVTAARSQIMQQGADIEDASAFALMGMATAIIPDNAAQHTERVRGLAAAFATILYELTTGQRNTRPNLRVVR